MAVMLLLPKVAVAAVGIQQAEAVVLAAAGRIRAKHPDARFLLVLPDERLREVAARIVEYRQKNGPFKKIEEIMNVQGIGEKSFLRLRAQLTVVSKADAAGQQ